MRLNCIVLRRETWSTTARVTAKLPALARHTESQVTHNSSEHASCRGGVETVCSTAENPCNSFFSGTRPTRLAKAISSIQTLSALCRSPVDAATFLSAAKALRIPLSRKLGALVCMSLQLDRRDSSGQSVNTSHRNLTRLTSCF